MRDQISIAYVMLNEELLLEDRLQYLKDNTKPLSTAHDAGGEHKNTPDIIDHFAQKGDPSKNKKHTQYIVGLYSKGLIRQEDTGRIHKALSNFDKYQHKLPEEDRQITAKKYPTIGSIEDKVAPHVGTMASKKEAEKTLDQPGHELKYEDDKIKVYHLTDEDASKNLYGGGHERGGTGTSWCTAARSDDCRFNYYHNQGPIQVIHRKSDGAVFQAHPATNQFMDKKDETISKDDFLSIAPSLHKAWKEHPELLGDDE